MPKLIIRSLTKKNNNSHSLFTVILARFYETRYQRLRRFYIVVCLIEVVSTHVVTQVTYVIICVAVVHFA